MRRPSEGTDTWVFGMEESASTSGTARSLATRLTTAFSLRAVSNKSPLGEFGAIVPLVAGGWHAP
jgi:hypothetical protein